MSVAVLGLRAVSLALALAAEGPAPARLSPDQFTLLADRLAHGESFKVRIQAALILGAGGGAPAEPVLREVLRDDPAPPVRAAAALALADLDGVRAVPQLVESLADDDAFVRSEAGKALSLLATREGASLAPPLTAALALAPEIAKPPGLRILAGLGDSGADGLVTLIGDPAASVRAAAEGALKDLGRDLVDRALERGLRGGSFAVRAVAARLLGERHTASSLPLLADASADATEIPEVQAAAKQALDTLRDSIDERAEGKLLASSADPAQRVRSLVLLTTKAGASAEPACEAALHDKSPLVQAYAVQALGELGDRRALPALHELLGREDYAPLDSVISAAIHRIERAGATPALAGPTP